MLSHNEVAARSPMRASATDPTPRHQLPPPRGGRGRMRWAMQGLLLRGLGQPALCVLRQAPLRTVTNRMVPSVRSPKCLTMHAHARDAHKPLALTAVSSLPLTHARPMRMRHPRPADASAKPNAPTYYHVSLARYEDHRGVAHVHCTAFRDIILCIHYVHKK